MNPVSMVKLLCCNPRKFAETLLRRPSIARHISDEKAISIFYRLRFRREVNLQNPRTFNEKLLWLTLHDRRPEYVQMVDKYEAKQWLSAKLGGVIRTI